METLNYLKNKKSLTYFTALVNQTNASIMGLMTNIDTMHTLGNEILHTLIQKVHTILIVLHTLLI